MGFALRRDIHSTFGDEGHSAFGGSWIWTMTRVGSSHGVTQWGFQLCLRSTFFTTTRTRPTTFKKNQEHLDIERRLYARGKPLSCVQHKPRYRVTRSLRGLASSATQRAAASPGIAWTCTAYQRRIKVIASTSMAPAEPGPQVARGHEHKTRTISMHTSCPAAELKIARAR